MTSMIAPSVDVMAERRAVVTEASTWLDTPFHHGACIKGVGVDCAQLLIAVYSETGVIPAIDPGVYPRDWFLHDARERILEIVNEFMVPTTAPALGDVALFRYGRAVSHAAIVLDWPILLHAYRGRSVSFDRADGEGTMSGRLAGCWTPRRWVP